MRYDNIDDNNLLIDFPSYDLGYEQGVEDSNEGERLILVCVKPHTSDHVIVELSKNDKTTIKFENGHWIVKRKQRGQKNEKY